MITCNQNNRFLIEFSGISFTWYIFFYFSSKFKHLNPLEAMSFPHTVITSFNDHSAPRCRRWTRVSYMVFLYKVTVNGERKWTGFAGLRGDAIFWIQRDSKQIPFCLSDWLSVSGLMDGQGCDTSNPKLHYLMLKCTGRFQHNLVLRLRRAEADDATCICARHRARPHGASWGGDSRQRAQGHLCPPIVLVPWEFSWWWDCWNGMEYSS